MKLKIILTKNGQRFDRLYSLIEIDIFQFYTKLLQDNLQLIAQQILDEAGYATIDLNTETLAASVKFHDVSVTTQDKIKELLQQDY